MAYSEGSTIARNASELDKLIQGFEFENHQLVKLIEKENQEIEAAESNIKEKCQLISQLQEIISQLDEDTKSAHKQFTINRENCESLRKTANVLGEHEVALQQQLNSQVETRVAESKEQDEILQHYTRIVEDYKQKYKTFPHVASYEESIGVVEKLELDMKEAEEAVNKMKMEVTNILDQDKHIEPLQDMRKFALHLSQILMNTKRTVKEIEMAENEKEKIHRQFTLKQKQLAEGISRIHLVNEDAVSISQISISEDSSRQVICSSSQNQENGIQATLISVYSNKDDESGEEPMNDGVFENPPLSCENNMKDMQKGQEQIVPWSQGQSVLLSQPTVTRMQTDQTGMISKNMHPPVTVNRTTTSSILRSSAQVPNINTMSYSIPLLQSPQVLNSKALSKTTTSLELPMTSQQSSTRAIPKLDMPSIRQDQLTSPRIHPRLSVPSSPIIRPLSAPPVATLAKQAAARSNPTISGRTPCNPPATRPIQTHFMTSRPAPADVTVSKQASPKYPQIPFISPLNRHVQSSQSVSRSEVHSPKVQVAPQQASTSSFTIPQTVKASSPSLMQLEPCIAFSKHNTLPATPKRPDSTVTTVHTPPNNRIHSTEEFKSPGNISDVDLSPKTPENILSADAAVDPVSPFDLEKHLQKIQQLAVSPKGPLLSSRPMFSLNIEDSDQDCAPSESFEMRTFNFGGKGDGIESSKDVFAETSPDAVGSFNLDFGGGQFSGIGDNSGGNPLLSMFGGSGDCNNVPSSMETEQKSSGFSFSFNSPGESDSASPFKLF